MISSNAPDRRTVAILLSTYNGEKYLAQQLDSLLGQTCPHWQAVIRDDGSTDATLCVVRRYAAIDRRIRLHEGVAGNLGPAASFSVLLAHALAMGFERAMFCDQDDIWEPDKIALGIARLESTEAAYPGLPVLLHTDLTVVNAEGALIAPSFWEHTGMDPRLNSTSRLLLENTVTGCTALLNGALMRTVFDIPAGAIMHDWWIALVASVFGRIEVLDASTVRYRQHDANVFGARDGISRLPYAKLLRDTFWRPSAYRWRRAVIVERPRRQARCLLDRYDGPDAPHALDAVRKFCATEKAGWLDRRRLLLHGNILRQRARSNVSLFLLI